MIYVANADETERKASLLFENRLRLSRKESR